MAMNTDKLTKKDLFNELKSIVEGNERTARITTEDLLTFINKELTALDKKSETSRLNREKKKETEDELTEAVFNCLSEEDFLTTPQILKMLNDEDATHAKVTARLTKLVKAEKVEKDAVVVEGSDGKKRKLQGYRAVVR